MHLTGSILVGCAHFGAMTIGGDIDPRVLRGDTKLNQQVTGLNSLRSHFPHSLVGVMVSADMSYLCSWQRDPQTFSQTLRSTRWTTGLWTWLRAMALVLAGGAARSGMMPLSAIVRSTPHALAECIVVHCRGVSAPLAHFCRLSNLQRHTECELARVRSARRSSGRSRRPALICTTPAPLRPWRRFLLCCVVSVLAATCPTSLSPCPTMCRTCCETCLFSPRRRWLWADDSSTGCPPPTSACPPPFLLQLGYSDRGVAGTRTATFRSTPASSCWPTPSRCSPCACDEG